MTAVESRYPYFFIDIDALGLPAVLVNVAALVFAFLALVYAIYGIDRVRFKDGRPQKI